MKYKNGSILHAPYFEECCYMCMKKRDYSKKPVLHKHHIFMGPLRRISEKQGFFVWLCPRCHTIGEHAVHRDYTACRKLQGEAQRAYEKDHTRAEFMELIGKSFV